VTADFGSITCLGTPCKAVHLTSDVASGGVKVRLRGPYLPGAARFVISTHLPLRIYIVDMELPIYTPDEACVRDHILIDTLRYCNYKKPEFVDVPRSLSNLTNFEWLGMTECKHANCAWELFITSNERPELYTVSMVDFEFNGYYHDPLTGIANPLYRFFFAMIVFVWIGFLLQEFMNATRFVQCVLWSDTCPGGRLHRTLIMMLVVVPRFLIWAWVLCVGIFLFISEYDYIEIVLNCVALAFLLDVDELLYSLAVPSVVKSILSTAEPHVWDSRSRGWLDIPDRELSVTMFCIILLVAFIILVQFFRPMGFDDLGFYAECLCNLTGPTCHWPVLTEGFLNNASMNPVLAES